MYGTVTEIVVPKLNIFQVMSGDPKSGSLSLVLVGLTITRESPNEFESLGEAKFIPCLS